MDSKESDGWGSDEFRNEDFRWEGLLRLKHRSPMEMQY